MVNNIWNLSLDQLITLGEYEGIEYKHAQRKYSFDNLKDYCVAIANSGGGVLVLGISNEKPHKVVGTEAFLNRVQEVKLKLHQELDNCPRIEIDEYRHLAKRVVVVKIHPRLKGTLVSVKGCFYTRVGESKVPLTFQDIAKIAYEEIGADYMCESYTEWMLGEDVVDVLEVDLYFKLLGGAPPTGLKEKLDSLLEANFLVKDGAHYSVTMLGLLVLAKSFDDYPALQSNRSVRVVTYEGDVNDNEKIRKQRFFSRGYALDFEAILEYIMLQVPSNERVLKVYRESDAPYPEVVVREILANAMIHQDISVGGKNILVSIYKNRLEVTNSGVPLLEKEKFISNCVSRNLQLSDAMRKMSLCESLGSGFDRAIEELEAQGMPAPSVAVEELSTTVFVRNTQDFSLLKKSDKIWASYCHCVMKHLKGEAMTNTSLRERFMLEENNTKKSIISRLIKETEELGLIKKLPGTAQKNAGYIPVWA